MDEQLVESPVRPSPLSRRGNFWQRWIANPHPDITDPGERLTAQLVFSLSLVFGFLNLSGAIGASLINPTASILSFYFSSALGFLGAILSRRRNYQLGAYILVMGFTISTFIQSFLTTNDIRTSFLSFVPFTILLSITLLSVQGASVVLVLNLIGIVLLPAFIPEFSSQVGGTAGTISSLMVLGVISLFFRNRVEKLRLSGLARANQQLTELRDQLEIRVAERTERAEQARSEAEAARLEAETAREALEKQVWLARGQADLNERIRQAASVAELGEQVIEFVGHYLTAVVGAIFTVERDKLVQVGAYGFSTEQWGKRPLTEGLLGEVVQRQHSQVVEELPEDYLYLPTSLGDIPPRFMFLFPIVFQGQTRMVLELGFMHPVQLRDHEFMMVIGEGLAMTLQALQTRAQFGSLLVQTQKQAEKLQAQEEELRAANEEMEAQTKSLKLSEKRLKEKQAELEQANATLVQQLTEQK